MERLTALAVCATVAVWATVVQADVIQFDPDGDAAGNGILSVASIDFLPGNSLAQNVGDPTYTQFAQGRLGGLNDATNGPLSVAGLNDSFEITVVAKYEGTSVSFGNTAVLGVAAAGENFVRMFYDDSPDADDLAGTGYDNGTLIFEGEVTGVLGNLTFDVENVSLFDQFVDDDYAGQQTRLAIGGLNVTVNATTAIDEFFKTPIQQFNVNSASKTPFAEVDPSEFFLGVAPVLGPVNGTGQDVQLQTDANGSFIIPEPASLALLGVGLLLIGARKRH